MSLQNRLTDLTTRIATEFKAAYARIGDLAALTTTERGSIVFALNELKAEVESAASSGGAVINDATTSTSATWSSTRITTAINGAIDGIVDGAPEALNTLRELADALGDSGDALAAVTTALGHRVRTDTAAQGLSPTEQANARTNIGAIAAADIGDPETNFVATFNAGLV